MSNIFGVAAILCAASGYGILLAGSLQLAFSSSDADGKIAGALLSLFLLGAGFWVVAATTA